MRLINLICEQALISAFCDGERESRQYTSSMLPANSNFAGSNVHIMVN